MNIAALSILAASLVIGVPSSAQPSEPAAVAPADASQDWRGQIQWQDTVLDIAIHLVTTESGTTGTMDIPIQGLVGGRLDDLAITADTMTFTLKPAGAPEAAWAKFLFKIDEGGKAATGEIMQAGQRLPVSLTLIEAGEGADLGPNRPQTPKPPFPYEARDVTYQNAPADVTLAATLTLPSGPGPHPAVILITGSGMQDRDETLFAHKPFLVVADHLTRHGIAVLRADDRGIGGSSGPVETATTDDFAGDALAGVEYLRSLPEIDHAHIGLIGHSEGGLIAPMAAAKSETTKPEADESEKVAFIVLLAGPGLPGKDIILAQSALLMQDAGADAEAIQRQTDQSRTIFDLITAGATDEEVSAEVRRIAREQIQHAVATGQMNEADVEATLTGLEPQLVQQTAQITSPWFRRFLAYDPRPALRMVRCPVLALIGEFDHQVPAEENLAELRKALEGNSDATVTLLPGLNHLFQTCDAARAMDYGGIEETFAPSALGTITAWVRARAGLKD